MLVFKTRLFEVHTNKNAYLFLFILSIFQSTFSSFITFDKVSEIWDKIPEKIEPLPEEIDLDEDLFDDDISDED